MNENKKILSFILLSSLMLSLSNFNVLETHLLHYQNLPLILFLIFLVEIFNSRNFSGFFAFALGLLSVLSILWRLDIGAYLNLAIFLLFFLLIFKYHINNHITVPSQTTKPII